MRIHIQLPQIDRLLQIGIFIIAAKISLSVSSVLYYTELMDDILTILIIMIFIISIIQQKYSFKVLGGYTAIGLIALYSVIQTGNYGCLITVITCMAIRQVDINKIIKHIFVYEIFFFFFIIFTSLVSYMLFHSDLTMSIDGETRFALGFSHPNSLSIYLFNLILMWVWVNYQNINIEKIVRIFVISTIAFLFTKTRTSYIDTLILCFMLLYTRKIKASKERALEFTAKFITPILAIALLILMKAYSSGNIAAGIVNKLLSSRIKLGAYGYEHYGISLLGQNLSEEVITWDPVWKLSAHTFDCVYSYLAVNQGIIWLPIICVMFYLLAKKRSPRINICIICWALYGICEVQGLNGYFCFPILLVTLLFSKYDEAGKLYKITEKVNVQPI